PAHHPAGSLRRPSPAGPPADSPTDALADPPAGLPEAARVWLERVLAGTETAPGAWETAFAEAGRRAGPGHTDAVRVLLLRSIGPDAATVSRLYERGSAAERRAVLLALPHLDLGPDAVPLVEDALRTNDARLVAAALGDYAARHLTPHAWRHAVLKCLFTGIPVRVVAGLADRARGDSELARMLGDYAAERTAAGRAVPEDLHRVLALTRMEP
ncbi:EboA domain-containing protein, partial [Streptomyces sp. GC420]|uniref:EboA domain-containing protein n=1 Tax=Streptomyces sp. GC420 TaxID=2697568 RepID=UPI001AA102F4